MPLVDSIWGAKDSYSRYARVRPRYGSIYLHRVLHDEAYTPADIWDDRKIIFRVAVYFLKPYRFITLVACLFIFLLAYPMLTIWRWLDFIYLVIRIVDCVAQRGSLEFTAREGYSDYTLRDLLILIKVNVRATSIRKASTILFVLRKLCCETEFRAIFKLLCALMRAEFLWKPARVWDAFLAVVANIAIETIDNIYYSKLRKIFRIRMRIHRKTFLYNSIWYGRQVVTHFNAATRLNHSSSIKILKGRLLV